ncbi:MAG: diacylglycerol kinase family protein [Planctomycetota bacterium]
MINPAAGRAEPVLATLNRVFRAAGIAWQPFVTLESGDARRFASEAARGGFDAVAGYGGDGTISEVALGVRGSGVPLIVLPGGTGNVVAQELGVPLELEAAAAVVTADAARVFALDALEFDERYALQRIGIGADAEVQRDSSREAKDRLGWFAYLLSALEQFREPPIAEYVIELDGERHESTGVACMVANVGRLGRAGLRFSRTIDPFDGRLDVLLVKSTGLDAIAAVGAALIGLEANDEADLDTDALWHMQGEQVRIMTRPKQEVSVDGEPLGPLGAIDVRLQPGAIDVLL